MIATRTVCRFPSRCPVAFRNNPAAIPCVPDFFCAALSLAGDPVRVIPVCLDNTAGLVPFIGYLGIPCFDVDWSLLVCAVICRTDEYAVIILVFHIGVSIRVQHRISLRIQKYLARNLFAAQSRPPHLAVPELFHHHRLVVLIYIGFIANESSAFNKMTFYTAVSVRALSSLVFPSKIVFF